MSLIRSVVLNWTIRYLNNRFQIMEKFKENGYHRVVIACAVVYISYRLIKYWNKRVTKNIKS